MKKIEWKLGEEGSEAVIAKNLRIMDQLVQRLEVCCANPECKYPISAIRSERFAVPDVGDVCATCHGMYTAVSYMNPQLRNGMYFKNISEAEQREIQEFKRRRNNKGGVDGL